MTNHLSLELKKNKNSMLAVIKLSYFCHDCTAPLNTFTVQKWSLCV